jgi:hypothetical protein
MKVSDLMAILATLPPDHDLTVSTRNVDMSPPSSEGGSLSIGEVYSEGPSHLDGIDSEGRLAVTMAASDEDGDDVPFDEQFSNLMRTYNEVERKAFLKRLALQAKSNDLARAIGRR